jgi:beta-glucosidase
MTIGEKTAQLLSISEDIYKPGFFDDTSGAKRILRNGVGCIQPEYNNISETVEYRNLIQKYLKERTRLGIPAIFVYEGCHGVLKPEAKSFPMTLALSCSWDTLLFQKEYKVVSGEMRSRGAQLSLTPVIDISRDPR